jgi:uncharacterized protein YciI
VAYLLLEYQLVSDYLDRRGQYRDEHLALAKAAADRGEIAMAGALSDPADRAVFVFRGDDPAVAERFAQADPYVKAGIVTSWAARPWNVVVGG